MFNQQIICKTSQLHVISEQAIVYLYGTKLVLPTYKYKYLPDGQRSQVPTYRNRYNTFYILDNILQILPLVHIFTGDHGYWKWTWRKTRESSQLTGRGRRHYSPRVWNKLMHSLIGNIKKFKNFSDIVFLKIYVMSKSLWTSCLVLVLLCLPSVKLTMTNCRHVTFRDINLSKVRK